MSMPMKCPNPNCYFQFDPRTVPPGAVIACPQCGMQFQLPTAPPQAYSPANPLADSNLNFGSAPVASEQPPPNRAPSKKPATGKRKTENIPSEESGEAPKRRPSSGNLKFILSGVAVVVVICAVLSALVIFKDSKNFFSRNNQDAKYENYLVSFSFPKDLDGWVPDEGDNSGKVLLGANMIAFRKPRDNDTPLGYIVFQGKQMEYTPAEAELVSITTSALNKAFEEIPGELDSGPDKYLGLDAVRINFRGVYKQTNQTCAGVVYVAASKGIIYTSYAWGPEQTVNDLQGEFAKIRDGMQFLPIADTTNALKPLKKDYRGKGPAYKLFVITDHEAIWYLDRNVDPKSRGSEFISLYLEGDLNRKLNQRAAAEFFVVILDAAADPKAVAEDFIKSQLPKSDIEPEVAVVDGEPIGAAPKVIGIEPQTTVTRWKVRYRGADNTVNKFVTYSTLETDGKIVVAYAICSMKDMPVWEQRLMLITGTLRKP